MSTDEDATPVFAEAAVQPEFVAPQPAPEPAPAPAAAPDAPKAPSGPTVSASGAVIPDFVEDARVVAQFEGARERFERAEAQAAEEEILADFRRRRELLQAEIATAQAVIDERQSKWERAVQAYGKRYPKLLEKNKPRKPGFMTNLLSFGSAGKMFNATIAASADLNDARSLRRRKEHDDEELDGLQRRALAKVDENQRAERQSGRHQEKFLARPGNAALAKRVREIQDERAAYGARVAAGKVPPLEARDRAFAQMQAVPLEAPFAGVAIVSVESYGELVYLIFRDRERKHFYRPYDPRLEGLSDAVFDIYRIADRFEARIHKREGKPMSLSDHLTEFLRDDERAKAEARRIRALLREPRNHKPQDTDKTLMDLLAELAKSAGRFGAGA